MEYNTDGIGNGSVCPQSQKVHLYLDRELSTVEALEFKNHISTCASCGELLKEHEEQKGILSQLATATIAETRYHDRWQDIERRIDASRRIEPLYRLVTVMSYGFLLVVGLAVGAIVTIAVSIGNVPAAGADSIYMTGGSEYFAGPITMGGDQKRLRAGSDALFSAIEDLSRNYRMISTELSNIKMENDRLNVILRNWADPQGKGPVRKLEQEFNPIEHVKTVAVPAWRIQQLNDDYQKLLAEYKLIRAQTAELTRTLDKIKQRVIHVSEESKTRK